MEYPAKLKRAYWDKNKGTIAKAAGETGMGEAMADAEKSFATIDWDAINAKPPGQQDYTPEKWQKALDAALGACDGQTVVHTRLALLHLESTAEDTVKKFNDSKLKKLISKSDVDRTQEIGTLAKGLRDSLDPARLKPTLVQPRFNTIKQLMDAASAAYVDTLKSTIKNATGIASGMLKTPTVDFFNANIQAGARGVHTQLSKAPTMSQGKVDLKKADALTKESKVWADGGFTAGDANAAKAEIAKFLKFLKDANELVAHH